VETGLRSLWAAAAALGLMAAAADARPVIKSARKVRKEKSKGADPARWFATRQGLIRVYEERANRDGSPAGISCEVIESTPGQTRELCTMIVARKPKAPAELTYELREAGIFMVKPGNRMLLPGAVKVGSSWKEPRGGAVLERRVRSAGSRCKVEKRAFGDCLVVAVVQRRGRTIQKRFTETYAAGVGLIEDAQWRLIDVQGL
jgi:hypothetical protein